MKLINIDRKNLKKKLMVIKQLSFKKEKKECYSFLKVHSGENGNYLFFHNDLYQVCLTIGGQCENSGELLIKIDDFVSIINKMKSPLINLILEEGKIKVEGFINFYCSINLDLIKDYSKLFIPLPIESYKGDMEARSFKNALQSVKNFPLNNFNSSRIIKYIKIWYDYEANMLNLAATNGHKLFKNQIKYKKPIDMGGDSEDTKFKVLLPPLFVKVLINFLSVKDNIGLFHNIPGIYENKKAFGVKVKDDYLFIGQDKIKDIFPSWESLIPVNPTVSLKFNSKSFCRKIKAMENFIPRNDAPSYHKQFTFSQDNINLSVSLRNNPDKIIMDMNHPCEIDEPINRLPFKINLNLSYLTDILTSLEEEQVKIWFPEDFEERKNTITVFTNASLCQKSLDINSFDQRHETQIGFLMPERAK